MNDIFYFGQLYCTVVVNIKNTYTLIEINHKSTHLKQAEHKNNSTLTPQASLNKTPHFPQYKISNKTFTRTEMIKSYLNVVQKGMKTPR